MEINRIALFLLYFAAFRLGTLIVEPREETNAFKYMGETILKLGIGTVALYYGIKLL